MNIQVFRYVIIVIWSIALVGFYLSIEAHPKSQKRERVWYSTIVVSYIIHVIVLFIVFSLPTNISPQAKNLWSIGVYIHGGVAFILKELAAILRIEIYKRNGFDE